MDDLERSKMDITGLDKSNFSMINKTAGFGKDLNSQQIENLKFKVRTLEKTNMNLLKEVRQYKDANNMSMMSMTSNSSHVDFNLLKDVNLGRILPCFYVKILKIFEPNFNPISRKMRN